MMRRKVNGVLVEMGQAEEAQFNAQRARDAADHAAEVARAAARNTEAQADRATIEAAIGIPWQRIKAALNA